MLLLVDNLMDLSHETYLHGGYIGTPEVADTPVTTVNVLWGTSKSMFLRLWTRAPRTTILSLAVETVCVNSEDIG